MGEDHDQDSCWNASAASLALPGVAYADDSGATAGAVTGGVAGAVVGGPVGAAVGAGAGAVAGGASTGPNERNVVIEKERTGTVVSPCQSRTVTQQNSVGDTRSSTTTNCP